MASRGCVTSPDCFCYICGTYVVKKQQRNISDFVKKVYFDYFGMNLGNQDKPWAPHKVCSICVEELRQWSQGKKQSFRFGIPMVWREPKNHSDDCYFCSCKVKGFNLKNKKEISYPNMPSAIRPVPHGPTIPIPSLPVSLDNVLDETDILPQLCASEEGSEVSDIYNPGTSEPIPFTQSELNDLVRDLGLPKDSAEVLGSRLKEKKLLASGTSFSWYRNREKDLVSFFSKEGDLVYCNNVPGVMASFNVEYVPEDWRLFIDSSKRSLKAVLLHNGNKYASVPVGHSVHLKETYQNLDVVLNNISYSTHKWMICGDLKVISMLLGQQSGYTKYPCFLCEWDSRDRKQHYIKKEWQVRKTLEVGTKNIERVSLIDPKKSFPSSTSHQIGSDEAIR